MFVLSFSMLLRSLFLFYEDVYYVVFESSIEMFDEQKMRSPSGGLDLGDMETNLGEYQRLCTEWFAVLAIIVLTVYSSLHFVVEAFKEC